MGNDKKLFIILGVLLLLVLLFYAMRPYFTSAADVGHIDCIPVEIFPGEMSVELVDGEDEPGPKWWNYALRVTTEDPQGFMAWGLQNGNPSWRYTIWDAGNPGHCEEVDFLFTELNRDLNTPGGLDCDGDDKPPMDDLDDRYEELQKDICELIGDPLFLPTPTAAPTGTAVPTSTVIPPITPTVDPYPGATPTIGVTNFGTCPEVFSSETAYPLTECLYLPAIGGNICDLYPALPNQC